MTDIFLISESFCRKAFYGLSHGTQISFTFWVHSEKSMTSPKLFAIDILTLFSSYLKSP